MDKVAPRRQTAESKPIREPTARTGTRILGAIRRFAAGIGDDDVRDRELNELAAAIDHLLRPGVVFSYDNRGWNAIRAIGALRRMIAKGILRGGWDSERAELRSAVLALLSRR